MKLECKEDIYGQYDMIFKKGKSYDLVSVDKHYYKVYCEFFLCNITPSEFIRWFYSEKETRKRKLEKLNFLFEQ